MKCINLFQTSLYNGVEICPNKIEKQVNGSLIKKIRRNNSRIEAVIKIQMLV
jgi:hypothetical protein